MNSENLVEIPYVGNKYTWSNNRQGDDLVLEKNDRAWCNVGWLTIFEHSILEVLPIAASDHAPLILHIEAPHHSQRRTFKFEAMWLLHSACEAIVNNAWSTNTSHQGSSTFRLINKIKITSKALSLWNKDKVGNLRTQIDESEKILLKIQKDRSNNPNTSIAKEELIIRKRLEFLLNCEQIYWA